jgi:hypothetical protein
LFLRVASAIKRLHRWWSSTDVSGTSLTSLGLITSAIAVEVVGILIWRHSGRRLELTAVGVQLIGVLLGAPVALARLRPPPPPEPTASAGMRRIHAANALRRLANRWRLIVVSGFALVSLSFLLFLAAASLQATYAVKPLAWMFLVGIAIAGWGWSAALAPRRLRATLPPSVEVVTPLAAAENPHAEAALALAAVCCFVIATVLQFAAIYQG